MSDPVTNVEIEDVLSSIRRLVSNESKGFAPQSSNTPKPAPTEAGKLVLAPSFRVDDAAPDAGAKDAQDQAESVEDWSDGDDADDVEAWQEAGQDCAEAGDDAVDAGDEDGDEDEIHPPLEFRHVAHSAPDSDESDDEQWSAMDLTDDAADGDSPEDDVQGWDVDQWSAQKAQVTAPSVNEVDGQDTLKARVAELEQVVADRDDQWDPDGASDDAYSGSALSSLPWEDYSPDIETGTAEPKSLDDAASDPARDMDDAGNDASVKSNATAKPRIAMPLDDIPDNFVAEEEETVSPRDRDLADDDDYDDVLTANDDFLDEDALRDLVADIVRQELQGALGERITRNVRKLVRREIHRALTSQDLE